MKRRKPGQPSAENMDIHEEFQIKNTYNPNEESKHSRSGFTDDLSLQTDAQVTKQTYYDANEIIEELSDESNFIESPNKNWVSATKYSYLCRSNLTAKSNHASKRMKMRPYLKQLLKDVINSDFLYYIADFLNTKTIINLTAVNTMFKNSFRVYLPTRLQQEADYINLFIETNEELNKEFMKLVDTQIPISNGNWVNFNFLDTLRQISGCLSSKDMYDLKYAVKNIKPDNDVLFAPFCVLFSQKPKRHKSADGHIKETWKTPAIKLLGDVHFKKTFVMYDKDNLQEEVMLEAFEFLNRTTFDSEKVSKINSVLGKLIDWCRAIVSYHILIHPYRVRNFSTIDEDSNLFKFSNYVDQMMDRFYKLKSYLMKIDIMPRDTNFAFNLSHVRLANKAEECLINNLENSTLAKIFTFLPWKEAFNARAVSRKWRNSVLEHCDLRLSMFMAEIENLKIYNSDPMFRKLPFLYELGGFFSPQLQELDYILHEELGFVTKYHLNELKKVYKPTKIMRQIIQAFCILTGIQPKRRGRANGGVMVDYYSAFQTLIINQNNFLSFLKTSNVYSFKPEQVQKAQKCLQKVEAVCGAEGVFNTNQGVFQIYLWMKACITVQVILNPLNFVSNEYINASFPHEMIRQIEMMFQCLEKWRTLYSVKLHCSKNASSLRKIVQHCRDNFLDEESLNFIMSTLNFGANKIPQIGQQMSTENALVQFFSSFDSFCAGYFANMAKVESIPDSISNVPGKAGRSRNGLSMMSSTRTRSSPFSRIQEHLLYEIVYFYVDLPDLCKNLFNVNSTWNKAYKTHLNARIHLLSEETKQYEFEHLDIVESIRHKRGKYYSDYEIDPPRSLGPGSNTDLQKQRAIEFLNSFNYNEVSNLRRIKSYSKIYELFCAPLVVLFDQKPQRKATADGKVTISYWKTAFKIINDTHFLSKIRDFKLESISQEKFTQIEKFIKDDRFELEKAEKINKCLASLVSWSKGVYLFHQYLREWALTSIDHEILTNTEKSFAYHMDQMCYRNFRMLRFVQEKCTQYSHLVESIVLDLKASKDFD